MCEKNIGFVLCSPLGGWNVGCRGSTRRSSTSQDSIVNLDGHPVACMLVVWLYRDPLWPCLPRNHRHSPLFDPILSLGMDAECLTTSPFRQATRLLQDPTPTDHEPFTICQNISFSLSTSRWYLLIPFSSLTLRSQLSVSPTILDNLDMPDGPLAKIDRPICGRRRKPPKNPGRLCCLYLAHDRWWWAWGR